MADTFGTDAFQYKHVAGWGKLPQGMVDLTRRVGELPQRDDCSMKDHRVAPPPTKVCLELGEHHRGEPVSSCH